MYVSEIVGSSRGALAGVDSIGGLNGDGLGLNIGKSLKRIVKKPLEIHKKVAKGVGQFVKRQWKKDIARTKKFVGKYGKWIALAAQVLNFIPGLGIAVGLAIAAAAAAIAAASQVINVKAAAAASKKAEDQANAEATAQTAKAAQDEATARMDEAYLKGQQYFTENYKMTPDKWQAMKYEEKSKFLNEVVYDQHAKEFTESGVTKDAFSKLSIEQQHELITKLGAALEAAGDKLPFEEDFLGLPILAWVGIGGAIVISIPLVAWLLKKRNVKEAA